MAPDRAVRTRPPRPRISSDVHPTAVLRCLEETEHVPGDGEWSVTVLERATGRAMLDLVTALRLQSEPRGDEPCSAVLLGPTVVRLETASGPGMWQRPRTPAARPGPR